MSENVTKATRALSSFMESLNINLEDENFKETPARMAKAYLEMCEFLNTDIATIVKDHAKVFSTTYKGMIIQDPIRIYSLCSHHLLPVTYDIVFGYLPLGFSLGFSKSVKIIQSLASQPISQEDLTQQIVELFENVLHPTGIMVVVKGTHMCMSMRSSKSQASNITSAVKGEFKIHQETRNEFLTLAKISKW